MATCCWPSRAASNCGSTPVWFVPAAIPPHKQSRLLTSGDAARGNARTGDRRQRRVAVCQDELERGGVNYTVDTLEGLKAKEPGRELFLLMGADSLADLPNWKEPERICQLAALAVVFRSDANGGKSAGQALDWTPLTGLLTAEQVGIARSHQVQMPRIDLAAAKFDARVAAGQTIRYRTPRAVEKYIETHGLYRQAEVDVESTSIVRAPIRASGRDRHAAWRTLRIACNCGETLRSGRLGKPSQGVDDLVELLGGRKRQVDKDPAASLELAAAALALLQTNPAARRSRYRMPARSPVPKVRRCAFQLASLRLCVHGLLPSMPEGSLPKFASRGLYRDGFQSPRRVGRYRTGSKLLRCNELRRESWPKGGD